MVACPAERVVPEIVAFGAGCIAIGAHAPSPEHPDGKS